MAASLALSAASPQAQAQYRPNSTPVYVAPPAPPPPPSHISVGSQHYDGSISGMRSYLNSIQSSEPDVYRALDPKLQSLESNHTIGSLLLYGGTTIGGLIAIVPLLAHKPGDELSLTPLYVGLGVMLVSGTAGIIIRPGRSDFLQFINDHNRINPSSPMELRLGMTPLPGGGVGGLLARF